MVLGSAKMWTWLAAACWSRCRRRSSCSAVAGHMLQLGCPGWNGVFCGPHVPSGSAGQPVRHFFSGVVEHQSGLLGWPDHVVPVVSNTSISVQAPCESWSWNHQEELIPDEPLRQRISK